MKLDHHIVPSSDNKASAQFYAEAFGFREGETDESRDVLYVDETTKLYFEKRQAFKAAHYLFYVSASEYDSILSHITVRGIPYGDSPERRNNMSEYSRSDAKGFCFEDPDGHLLEVTTKVVSP